MRTNGLLHIVRHSVGYGVGHRDEPTSLLQPRDWPRVGSSRSPCYHVGIVHDVVAGRERWEAMGSDGNSNGNAMPVRAVAYADETAAVRAYMAIRDVLRLDERVDISAYRLMLPLGDDVRHSVAVVGDVTTLEPAGFVAIVGALSNGAPLVLPASVKAHLVERAGHARRMAPYVEAHHEGGRVFRVPTEG